MKAAGQVGPVLSTRRPRRNGPNGTRNVPELERTRLPRHVVGERSPLNVGVTVLAESITVHSEVDTERPTHAWRHRISRWYATTIPR
jgi:hypothetical protein